MSSKKRTRRVREVVEENSSEEEISDDSSEVSEESGEEENELSMFTAPLDEGENSEESEIEGLEDDDEEGASEFPTDGQTEGANKDEPYETENLAEFSDSSHDEEDPEGDVNRIGNVPLEWYKDYDHIGYDIQGKKIARKTGGDSIEDFLQRQENPALARRTIYDAINDRKVVLTNEEMEIVHRLRQGKYPHKAFDPEFDHGYAEYYFNRAKRVEALGNPQEPKRRFIPSKWEAKAVVKLVNAIRNGWMRNPNEPEEVKKEPETYLLWTDDSQVSENKKYGFQPIPAPKPALPGHAESYNPPEEYLLTEEEKEQRELLDPEDRELKFVPQQHDSMRKVGLYKDLIKERFERCLDLYLCARVRKKRMNVDPESLVPQLPKPQDLRPFPSMLTMEYLGHTDKVRCMSVSPCGQWLATGSDDQSLRVWEVETGRCHKLWQFTDIVTDVAWNPHPDYPLLLVATGLELLILHTNTSDETRTAETDALLRESVSLHSVAAPATESKKAQPTAWTISPTTDDVRTVDGGKISLARVVLALNQKVVQAVWHHKGDYFATTAALKAAKSVQIHRLSKGASTTPFSKAKGHIQKVMFHPIKPVFYVATKRHIRVYNLAEQRMLKTLLCPAQWISSLAIHPGGDNVLCGSYDRRVCWYDMDLGASPYKTLKYHKKAVRGVQFHKSYPLFASCSDDGALHIFHGKVYNDLLTNPLIVPVKILHAHEPVKDLGVLSVAWHPNQPWVFSSGADAAIRLFT